MISSFTNTLSAAGLNIKGRQTSAAGGPALTLKTGAAMAAADSAAEKKISIYDNFGKEMAQRLNESLRKSGQGEEESPDPAILAQSLTGAMGQIEQLFGREAATEVMAQILTGTVNELSEESLLNSIQTGLAGLSRQDALGTKVKELTQAFNQDLTLALNEEEAGQKLADGETLSLSYALARHFGGLEAVESRPAGTAPEAEGDGLESPAASKAESGPASYQAVGFNENGRWDQVELVEEDAAAAEELKQAAEAAVSQLTDLNLATIVDKGNGAQVFSDLASFLRKELDDKEAAAFVDDGLSQAYAAVDNKYGKSPKMADLISQVYSKVAADGDADKLLSLENYLNGNFKDAINPVLNTLQQEGFLGGADIGQLQFKGLSGASLAGDSDAFSLKWGFADDDSYDRSVGKRFLQEDIRAVKEAKEKLDDQAQKTKHELRAETVEGKLARETWASTQKGDGPASVDKADKELEEYNAGRRQDKLNEALTTKVGQLDDGVRQELEQYLADNFDEELSDQLLDKLKWNDELMSGLAGVHSLIEESGTGENQAENFLKFANDRLKGEMEKIADRLGGLEFQGWQAAEGRMGEIEASFRFTGQDQDTRVTILEPLPSPDQVQHEEETVKQPELQAQESRAAAESNIRSSLIGKMQKQMASGYLINLMV